MFWSHRWLCLERLVFFSGELASLAESTCDGQSQTAHLFLKEGGVQFQIEHVFCVENNEEKRALLLATSKYKHVFADPIDLRHHVLLIGLGSFANSGRIRFRSVSRARPGICRSKPLSRPLLAKPPGPAVSGDGA